MDDELQDAQIQLRDGTTLKMRVPAFPGNPELVVYLGDRFAIANSPVIGYGTNVLFYHEAVAYDTASDATPLPPLRPDGYWTRPRGEQSR